MTAQNIRPLTKGEIRPLGKLFPGMSDEQMHGKVLTSDGGKNATVEVTFMGVYLGDATLTKEKEATSVTGEVWSWVWN